MGGKRVFSGEFSKKFKKTADKDRSPAETAPEPKAEAAPEPPAETQPETVPLRPQRPGSVLAADAKIIGDVEFTGEFLVAGELLGDAQGGKLEVGESGRIDGRVAAEEVRVGGLVTGGVNARSVSVGKTGRILSDVEYVQLSVEAGAQLNGLITPRDAPSVAEVVSRVPPRKPAAQAEPKARRLGTGSRASRSGINFAPTAKKVPRPLN